jgi:hypothetical protein
MRKATLVVLSALIAYAIVFSLIVAGFRIPFGLSYAFSGLFLTPVLLLLLTPLNKYLLAWRKGRGRDIAEEEKYEQNGVISLRPRPEGSEDESTTFPYFLR